ncbi:MAG: DUF5700 domain-containing putative Zn-dependent protease [Candidatus Heimdallarchaeaceae archaeon]
MKSSSGVKIDSSFVDISLQYFTNPSEELLAKICEHIVAKKVLSNAQISDSNLHDIEEFWRKIIEREREKGEEHFSAIRSCLAYIDENEDALFEHLEELRKYLPDDFVFDCTLYLEVGYDIGIVADGDALLNVGHPIFHKNKRELIYFALHELHHVGYTHYNALDISFAAIQTRADLVEIIEKLTHLEGTATYAIKEIREKESQISFFDYEVLFDVEKLTESNKQYFELYDKYRYSKNLMIEESDLDVFEIMSGKEKRLWYVTGAHIAEGIDRMLGRGELNQTIVNGPNTFFEKFFKLRMKPS